MKKSSMLYCMSTPVITFEMVLPNFSLELLSIIGVVVSVIIFIVVAIKNKKNKVPIINSNSWKWMIVFFVSIVNIPNLINYSVASTIALAFTTTITVKLVVLIVGVIIGIKYDFLKVKKIWLLVILFVLIIFSAFACFYFIKSSEENIQYLNNLNNSNKNDGVTTFCN